jgi:hypothetical protein
MHAKMERKLANIVSAGISWIIVDYTICNCCLFAPMVAAIRLSGLPYLNIIDKLLIRKR